MMWNKLSQAAALVTGETEEENEPPAQLHIEDKEKLEHQEQLITQLKELVRENEKRFQDKTKECEDITAKFEKFKLHSKAKITHLSKQIKDQEKTTKKEDCDFDDASSTDSSDKSYRGRVLLLKKQLEQAKQQLDKKEEESKTVTGSYERKINDLELQLNEKNMLISSLADSQKQSIDSSPKKESNVQEMYAQIVYKDSKILDLNNQILELEKKMMDLQENLKEKDEVLHQRNKAVQLMAEDLNRKGQTTVIQLDETRDQMKIMQQNFSDIETDWKSKLEKYQIRINELENEIKEWDSKLKNSEASAKSIESTRYELSVKNAELQQKIVHVQESASKQCEQFNKEIQSEIKILKENLESEKQRCAELQKSLDESSNESKNKVFKARVEERTKLKKLERELNELKKEGKDQPEELTNLQQQLVVLEEEKGSLQLKLIEIEDQVNQLEKLKEENFSLNKTSQEVLREIEILKKRIADQELKNQSLNANFNSLQIECSQEKEKFNILKEDYKKIKETLSSVLEEKKTIDDNFLELQEMYQNIEKEYTISIQKLEQLKDEKVTFELKSIELEEMRDKDAEEKKILSLKIEELLKSEGGLFDQLKEDNFKLKDRIKYLEELNHSLEENNRNAIFNLENLQKENFEKNNFHNSEIGVLNDKMNDLENKNTYLQQNLDTCDNELKHLENSLKEAEDKIQCILGLFNANNIDDLHCVKNNLDELLAVKQSLSLGLQEKEDMINSCTEQINELKKFLEQQKKDLLSKENLITELNNTVLEKNNSNEKLLNDFTNITQQQNELKCALQEKEQQILIYINEQAIYQDKCAKMESLLAMEHEKTDDKVKVLLDQMSDLEKELTLLHDEMNSKDNIVCDLNTKIDKLSVDNKSIMEKCTKSDELLQFKDENLENLNLNIEEKNSEIINLNKLILELNQSLKDKDILLSENHKEYEKLLNVKEEYIAQIESQINQIETEKQNLCNSLERKIKDLELTNSECLNLNAYANEQQKQNAELSLKVVNYEKEISNLKDSSESFFCQLNEKESCYQTVIEENCTLKDKLCELTNSVNKLEKDLNAMTLSIENKEKQCCDFSKQVECLNKELQKSNELKLEFDCMFSNYEKDIANLTDENKLLKAEIVSMQEKHTTEIIKLQEEMSLKIKNFEAELNSIKAEKDTFSEINNSLQSTISDYEVQIKDQQDEKVLLYNKISNYDKQIKLIENKYKSIEDELSICKMKLSGEKSELEIMLQNSMAENNAIKNTVQELKIQINEYEKELDLNKNSITLYEESNKHCEVTINELRSQIQVLEDRILNLQNNLTQKETEFNSFSNSFKTKLSFLELSKKQYYKLLNSFKANYPIEVDISVEKSEHITDQVIENFVSSTEKANEYCLKSLLDREQNIAFLEQDLNKLTKEKNDLQEEILTSKECLLNAVSIISTYSISNESKFYAMMNSLKEKENSITNFDSKINQVKLKLININKTINKFIETLNKSSEKVKKQIKISEYLLRSDSTEEDTNKNEEPSLEIISIPVCLYDENSLANIITFTEKVISRCTEINNVLNDVLESKIDFITKTTKEKEMSEQQYSKLESDMSEAHISEVNALKHEIKGLNECLEQFTSQSDSIKNMNLNIEELQTSIKNYEQKINELGNENSSLNKQIEETNVILRETLKEKDIINLNLEESQKKNLELQMSLSEKENVLTELEKSYEEIKILKQTSDDNVKLISKLLIYEKDYLNIKNILNRLQHLKLDELETYNLSVITSELNDKDSIELISLLYNKLKASYAYIKENESLLDQIKILESKTMKTAVDSKSTQKDDIVGQSEKIVVTATSIEPCLETNLTQQQSPTVMFSDKSFKTLEDSNKSLREELAEYKKKFAKMLTKLKYFKDEKEKLNEELTKIPELEKLNAEQLEKMNQLVSKIKFIEHEQEILMKKLQTTEEQNKQESNSFNSAISQMKERYSDLEEKFYKTQHELQEYKQTWEQTNVSYELLKEDSERLKLKLRNATDKITNLKIELTQLNTEITELKMENVHLKKEGDNLREHADMLISDNDNFQNCNERLTAAKNTLERKIAEMKEKFNTDIMSIQAQHQAELSKLAFESSKESENVKKVDETENECLRLRNLCTDLQIRLETLQLECDTNQKNLHLLEKEKQYLQHSLSDKADELQKIKLNMNEVVKTTAQSLSSKGVSQYDHDLENLQKSCEKLKEENGSIKQQFNVLNEELNFTKEMNSFLQQELSSKETSYIDKINQLETQLQNEQSLSNHNQTVKDINQTNLTQLENELQQALNNLHNQGLRCEELSGEVNKLLEERNVLKWQLQQYMHLNPGVLIEQENSGGPPSAELVSIKVESPFNASQMTELHQRLLEAEKTCLELRKANDALDRALMNERDQKRIIEEELDLAKEHLTEETRASNEYHILLGEINDSEMSSETNSLINRNLRTHVYKFHHWLRGRRNYLSRILKSRNYPHIIYMLYIFFIHIWLLSCVFS